VSDARLRELERRWKETGSPDDEAAYLLERVRVGDLTRERLELAAYCGRQGAARACASQPPAEGRTLMAESLRAAMATLLRVFGVQALVRACMAIFEGGKLQGDASVAPILARTAEWLYCKSPESALAVRSLADQLWGSWQSAPSHDRLVASATIELARVVAEEEACETSAYRVIRLLDQAGIARLDVAASTIAASLVKWSLGQGK